MVFGLSRIKINYCSSNKISLSKVAPCTDSIAWQGLCIGQIEASKFPSPLHSRATPQAFDFFENYCSNSPLPGPKCHSNAPHKGPFRLSNAPTPGTFHRHINDRRMAETPSVVEENHYKYSKQFVFNITKTEKHCQHTYYKQNSCAKRRKSLLQGH